MLLSEKSPSYKKKKKVAHVIYVDSFLDLNAIDTLNGQKNVGSEGMTNFGHYRHEMTA